MTPWIRANPIPLPKGIEAVEPPSPAADAFPVPQRVADAPVQDDIKAEIAHLLGML